MVWNALGLEHFVNLALDVAFPFGNELMAQPKMHLYIKNIFIALTTVLPLVEYSIEFQFLLFFFSEA